MKYAPDGGSVVVEKADDYATFPGFGPRHMAVDELRNREGLFLKFYIVPNLETSLFPSGSMLSMSCSNM